MGIYQRLFVPGGTYFFTLVTADRRPWWANSTGCRILSRSMRSVRDEMPFTTEAIVILPDHLHVIWTLPDGDFEYPRRWQRIKHRTTLALRREIDFQGVVWQPRYWEHWIRDDTDFERHMDYIHYNPVKHGLCDAPNEWLASSFHRYVAQGVYPVDWAGPTDEEPAVPE